MSCVEFRFSVGGFARSISFSVDPDYHRYRFIYFYQHSRSIFAFLTSIVSYSYEREKRARALSLSLHGISGGFSLNLHKRTEWNGFSQVCFFSGKIYSYSIEEETFSTGFHLFQSSFFFFFPRIAGNAGGTNVCFRGNKSFFRTKSKEVVSREDGQSGERKIGAAICSENRPFLPAFPFKKRLPLPLVSQHRVSFQDLPLSSFLPLNYRGRKLRVRRGKLLFRRKVKDPLRAILHFTRITLDSDESDRKTVSKISSVHHR